MSKYENNVFPYSVHSTVNLPARRPKDINVSLISFFVCLLRQLFPTENFFFRNYMTNVVKIDEIREELSTSHFVT